MKKEGLIIVPSKMSGPWQRRLPRKPFMMFDFN